MKAIEIQESGNLAVCERPLPTPAKGEVLIRVAAAGMNRADLLQRKGFHPPPAGASDLPGLEVAGIVTSVGKDVPEAMIGERVCALLSGGGYAEFATAPMSLCLPVPDTIDLAETAGLPEAMFTVAKNIFIIGQLRPDDHLLIHGGSSGIGTMAIQMAKTAGARISVTAGSEDKCQMCLSIGADKAINYKTSDFSESLKDDPVDIVLDMVGGDYISRNLSIMAAGGRHISIAYPNGRQGQIDIAIIMKKGLIVTGSTLRHDILEEKENYANLIRDIFWGDVVTRNIRPVIYRSFALEDAMQAHDFFAKGEHAGKILLKI